MTPQESQELLHLLRKQDTREQAETTGQVGAMLMVLVPVILFGFWQIRELYLSIYVY